MAGRRTQLASWHEERGARFTQDGEWEIPATFETAEKEYDALGNAAGFMDHCHESRIKVSGRDRFEALNRVTSCDVTRVGPNQLVPAFLCNRHGWIMDSVWLLNADEFILLLGSGLNRERLTLWLEQQTARFQVEVTDSSMAQGCIEVRGPMARSLTELSLIDGQIPPAEGGAEIGQIGQARCMIVASHYGEHECCLILAGMFYIQSVWDRLASVGSKIGAAPAGQQAQEIHRLEAGRPKCGREISEHTTPIELGDIESIDFDRKDFVARQALLNSACSEFGRRVVDLRIEGKAVPESGDRIELDGTPLGYVTSAAFSPRARCPLAMGIVDALKSDLGTELSVRGAKGACRAIVINPALQRASA